MVSSIFYFHPYLGKIPILTNIFQRGWKHQLVKVMSSVPFVQIFPIFLRTFQSQHFASWPDHLSSQLSSLMCVPKVFVLATSRTWFFFPTIFFLCGSLLWVAISLGFTFFHVDYHIKTSEKIWNTHFLRIKSDVESPVLFTNNHSLFFWVGTFGPLAAKHGSRAKRGFPMFSDFSQ